MSELLKKHSDRKHIAPLPDPSVTKPNLLVKAPRNAKPVGGPGEGVGARHPQRR